MVKAIIWILPEISDISSVEDRARWGLIEIVFV
jgi:hypothetical protein